MILRTIYEQMKFKQIINAILLSSIFYTSAFAQDFAPKISDVAQQVRNEEKRERTKKLLSIEHYLENQIRKPEVIEREPLDYFCRSLLMVFGISADSYLSNSAVRQLKRKITKEAESQSLYFNEIGLKLDRPKQIDFQKNREIREISKIEYNLVSGLGIQFRPYKNVYFETKLAGSADPFKLKATPKIKSELSISDYLEFYGEIRRTINRDGLQPEEYEVGFNLDVLRLWKRYHHTKERKPLKEVIDEWKNIVDNK